MTVQEWHDLIDQLAKAMKPEFIVTWLLSDNAELGYSPMLAIEWGEKEKVFRMANMLGSGQPI